MGSYNSQYESYYSNMLRRKGNYPYRSTSNSKSSTSGFKFDRGFFIKRIMQELIGVLCLFLIVLTCKTVKIPQTTNFYNYAKEVISLNYDYKKIYEDIKQIKISDVEEEVQKVINEIKNGLSGGEELNNTNIIKNNINRAIICLK